jgi:anti-sigma factor RsiW
MMTCAQAREALLDAEVAELSPSSGSPLAAHFAACAECRRLADRILLGTDALRRERSRRPREPADEAAPAARQEATRIRRMRRRWLAATPALAAAAVAAILLARSWGSRLPSAPAAASAASAAAGAPTDLPLVAGAAHTVAVFETANPKIVVVWQFPD